MSAEDAIDAVEIKVERVDNGYIVELVNPWAPAAAKKFVCTTSAEVLATIEGYLRTKGVILA